MISISSTLNLGFLAVVSDASVGSRSTFRFPLPFPLISGTGGVNAFADSFRVLPPLLRPSKLSGTNCTDVPRETVPLGLSGPVSLPSTVGKASIGIDKLRRGAGGVGAVTITPGCTNVWLVSVSLGGIGLDRVVFLVGVPIPFGMVAELTITTRPAPRPSVGLGVVRPELFPLVKIPTTSTEWRCETPSGALFDRERDLIGRGLYSSEGRTLCSSEGRIF